jgi:hypothetical protein
MAEDAYTSSINWARAAAGNGLPVPRRAGRGVWQGICSGSGQEEDDNHADVPDQLDHHIQLDNSLLELDEHENLSDEH